jgi:hypothetical protein
MEIDGIPLSGKIGASNLQATINNGKIHLKWDKKSNEGKAKIWLAKTNNFKTGTKDNYKLVAQVPLSKGKAEIDAGSSADGFYKIVLETPYNTLNRWIVPVKK